MTVRDILCAERWCKMLCKRTSRGKRLTTIASRLRMLCLRADSARFFLETLESVSPLKEPECPSLSVARPLRLHLHRFSLAPQRSPTRPLLEGVTRDTLGVKSRATGTDIDMVTPA
eukprot:1175410-Prorocentrum_minimum.AAC.2